METVWANRRQLVASLADANFDLVLVPSFSTWDRVTRLEHGYQVARGLRFLELLVHSGIPTVPNVAWYLERDISEWARELMNWAGPRAFSVDIQTLQTEEKWDWGLRALRLLADKIGSGWEVLVNGVGRADNIGALTAIFGHIHLINARAYELAMANRMPHGDLLTKEIRTDPAARMATFAKNVAIWSNATYSPALCQLRASMTAAKQGSSST